MEKTLIELIWVPVLGVEAWLERTKVGRPECKATHEGVQDKLKMIHEDVRAIRDTLERHMSP